MAQATKKRASAAKRKKATASARPASRAGSRKPTASTGVTAGQRAARTRDVAAATISGTAALGHMNRLLREVGGIVCLFSALILVLALTSFDVDDPGWSHTGTGIEIRNSVGRAGAWFADVAYYLFGFMAYLIPLVLGLSGWLLFRDQQKTASVYQPYVFIRVIGIVLMLVTASGLADLHFAVADGALPRGTFGGGILGTATAWRLVAFLHPLGTTLLLLALFFSSLTLAFGTSWMQLIETLGATVLRVFDQVRGWFMQAAESRQERTRVRVADQARAEHLRPDWVNAPAGMAAGDGLAIGDPLLDNLDSAQQPRAGIAAALGAARQKAKRGAAAALRMVSPRSDPSIAAGMSAGRQSTGGPTAGSPTDRFDIVADALHDNSASGAGESSGIAATAARSALTRASATVASAEQNPAASSIAAVPAPAAAARKKKISIKQRAPEQKQAPLFLDVPDSDLPPLALLDTPEPQRPGFSNSELESLSRLLEEKLAEFRITVEVVAVHPGPVITRFEMQLAPGIKASRITGLSQDIARSMSLVSVRVVEVIPGKSTIGIEVPNEHREMVLLSEMLQSREFMEKSSPLTLALGKGIAGQPVMADLARMPHLLVAGTTGSGKSVAVNAMLISLLYKATAKEVRLILIDPKMLELNVYDGIPHLLTPVVTDMKEAANALRWCVGEMERRYTVMAELKVRNLAGYNKRVEEAIKAGAPIVDPLYKAEESLTPTAAPPTLEPMPVIVVVIDEFADMMMQVGKKAEEMIARIAQKARAAGIHLILATQRPSVDVITGLIKANVPTRIAFQVSQKVDSRTVLDQGGAESLLGHGDMLYLPPGTALPVRVHGAFVDDHEVNNVVAHIKQFGEPNYIEEILQESTVIIPGLSGGSEDSDAEVDALYDQAVAIVCESRKASISYVQRRLKIGYNRAARMIEEMEASGVVSQTGSNGMREVLAPPPI